MGDGRSDGMRDTYRKEDRETKRKLLEKTTSSDVGGEEIKEDESG
jgi:hypothetical protein